MSDRIGARFARLRQEGRGGLVTFVTAGDPDARTSRAILAGLPRAGADLIELGMPFSDPMADGPAIQASSQRALQAGASLRHTLAMVGEFRQADEDTPLVLMGYYNPIYAYGADAFLADAAAAGVDGLIVIDLPPEEDEELSLPAIEAGLHVIRLATPTTDDGRLPAVLARSSGFIYYVSITGITGTASAASDDVAQAVARLRRHTELPIAVGFGIKTAAQAAAVTRVADAVVVGSALVETVAAHLDAGGKAMDGLAAALHARVGELAAGARTARADA